MEGGKMKEEELRNRRRSFADGILAVCFKNLVTSTLGLETQLKRQNEILRQMLDIMPRPTGKFRNILETAVLFASVFGIIGLIDVIMKWVIGG
jgi:hypothetical protein